jgi:AhpD family alkylhydroperoxidase
MTALTAFTVHTQETAPDESRSHILLLAERIGFLPNLAATLSESPAAIGGFVHLQTLLHRCTLRPIEREVVGLTVSYANRCAYSMAAHSTFALKFGADDALLSALRSGHLVADARLRAVQQFTRAVLATSGHLGPSQLDSALDAGFSREQLLVVLTQIAHTTLANLTANLADLPIDEAFRSQSWSPPARPDPVADDYPGLRAQLTQGPGFRTRTARARRRAAVVRGRGPAPPREGGRT